MSATPSAVSPDLIQPKKPRSTVVRKKTHKPSAVQSAITLRRANGQSKRQIAKELGIARNTVTSVLELNHVEQQIAQYRSDTLAICPKAIVAVTNQIESGDGDLGLRLLERAGVIGEDALETIRRNSQRQAGAINVLVQAGATVNATIASGSAGNHNVPLSDAPPTYSNDDNAPDNCTVPVNDKVTDSQVPPLGKHPKAAPTHQ